MKINYITITQCIIAFFSILVINNPVYAQSGNENSIYSHEVAPGRISKIKTKTIGSRDGKYDLSWLDKAIKTKKVLMLGENHWMSAISDMEQDIVFYANEKGSFPVLVLENSYSSSGYINAYINCPSGTDCSSYLEILKPVITSKESVRLLNRLREWNVAHPDKKITVACTDVEQDLANTLHTVVVPYFKELGDKKLFAMINKEKRFTDEIVAYMDSTIQHSPAPTKVKDKTFLNKQFLQNVMINFRIRYDASSSTEGQGLEAFEKAFFPARLERIKRYISDDAVFGKLIKENNSIFIGGASHARIYVSGIDDEEAMNWEGWYLTNEFAATKGQVYSIKLYNISYDIPAAYFNQEFDTDNAGLNYMVAGYKDVFPGGGEKGYKIIDGLTDVTAALIPYFKKNNDQPVRLQGNAQMKKLLAKSPVLKEDRNLKEFYGHDVVVVFPKATLFDML
ncbi:hypothetical protein ACSX1A_08815 [Pontibacter sp. MBLB2868]|uniref:hypothetical protein n=1 Tax=Pontibacter sp. MBLB2868 TaxID=3451555 RepID=UPI003F74D504